MSLLTLLFDVNETLLDLGSLDPLFQDAFGDAGTRRSWFQTVLQSALVSTVIGEYRDFTEIQYAALDTVARRLDVEVDRSVRDAIVGGMKTLSPHPDVLPALTRLRAAGFHLATLTNSPRDVATAQMEHAGLARLFDQRLSADAVRRLKPAPEPYRFAAKSLGVPTDQILLIAAHDWDVAGAQKAGCRTAFVARPGATPNPLFPPPDLTARDLIDLADRILAEA